MKKTITISEKLLRKATATRLPCLLPVWLAWLIGRLQTHGLVVTGPDCEAPYVAWLLAKLAVYDAKVQQRMAKAMTCIDLRQPAVALELEHQRSLPADDEVAARRIKARCAALEREEKELQALSDKAKELADARHAQAAAKIPPRIRAFVQGASHRNRALDQAAVTARLCAALARTDQCTA